MNSSVLKDGTVVKYYRLSGELVGTGVICGSGEKNRMRVYDVDMPNGDTYWGYRDQFNIVSHPVS